MNKEQNNYVHVGETVACGHCRPDEIFELMEKYGLECDCKCHQEPKLPECNLHKNIEYGMCTCGWKKLPELNCPKCHSSQHSSESCITREEFQGTEEEFNKKYKVISPQKEEPKWEQKLDDIIHTYAYHWCEDNFDKQAEDAKKIHLLISQEISKAWEAGRKNELLSSFQGKSIYELAKQEVISLCLEKLKDICNKSKTERGLAQALANYITALSDELKGI